MSDLYFPYDTLLVPFDGTNGATTTSDLSFSANALTFGGTAALSTAQKKFGTASLRLDGTGGALVSSPASAAFNFGSKDFTVEGWFRFDGAATTAVLLEAGDDSGSGAAAWYLYITGGVLRWRIFSGGLSYDLDYTWTPTANTWYAIAVDRVVGGKLRLYIDGVMHASVVQNRTVDDSTGHFAVGVLGIINSFPSYNFTGYVDELRITIGIARYASDAGYTPAVAAFPTTGDPYSMSPAVSPFVLTSYPITLTHPRILRPVMGAYLLTKFTASQISAAVASSVTRLHSTSIGVKANPVAVADGVGLHEGALQYAYQAGSIIAEVLTLQDTNAQKMTWGQVSLDTTSLSSTLSAALGIIVNGGGVGLHDVETHAIALLVLDKLFLHAQDGPAASYGAALVDLLKLNASLANFFGASISDALYLAPTQIPVYQPVVTASDTFSLHAALLSTLTFQIVMPEGVNLHDVNILNQILTGTLTDRIRVTAAYIAPSGHLTTWAVNTRMASISEYQNYNFRSFAKKGRKYLGAKSDGLYELNGNLDDQAAIISQIQTGQIQMGGSHFTAFKTAYLGMRATGNFVLRVITGDGATHDYAVVAQNMRTTKVQLGKGLRARYYTFELISTGQDFDLQDVEFVPITSARRV